MARPRRSAVPASRTPTFKRAKKFQPKPARAPWMGRLLRYVLALVSAAIMANAVFGARGLMTTIRARQDYAALEARVERMRADNDRMREEARRLREDPSAIETLARERLGLIYPGETLFIVSTAETQSEPMRRGTQRAERGLRR